MFVAFKQAINGLKVNPVRTALTTLGIVIGIATVILVLSAGEGFKSYVNFQVESFGTNTVFIETRVPPSTRDRNAGGTGGGLGGSSANQAVAITSLKQRDLEEIKLLSGVTGAYGAVIGQKVSSYRNVKKNAFIFGSSQDRFSIDKGVIEKGRPFTQS
jgi:ABC-type antimicrobial peptide transport system permease subunit